MPKSAPICRHCDKTYSAINEPIYMVCYCNNTIKYAHGSCFRDWLKDYKYGVCEECLTKTKIIPEEYKPVLRWKVPQSKHKLFGVFHLLTSIVLLISFLAITIWWQATQCYDAYCIALFVVFTVLLIAACLIGFFSKRANLFWFDFRAENKYWKIVYCREVLRKTASGQSLRRLSNVPMSISDYNENETKVNIDNGMTTSAVINIGESNAGYHDDAVFPDENIFAEHIFNPLKQWTPKSHLRIKKQEIHITDTFYASQSKKYINKKTFNFENNAFDTQNSYDDESSSQTQEEKQDGSDGRGNSNVGKTLSEIENDMWKASNLYNQTSDKGIVDDYIKSRAESFFNRRSSEKLSPSDEYIMELRQSAVGSNSSVNSLSDSGKTMERSVSLPSIHSDILPEKKRRKSKATLFKKNKRSKFKRHRSLTSIEVTIDQEFTFDSYITKRSRSVTSLATTSEKDFRDLDIQVKEMSRSIESVTSIIERDVCKLDENFTQERSNPMFTNTSDLNATTKWRTIPRTRDMAMTLATLPYTRIQNQELLDTYKSSDEKEIYSEKREEQSHRISQQFENDPRKVLQQFQNDFDKSMTQKIDYDLGVYQIGQSLKNYENSPSNYFNGTINSQKLNALELYKDKNSTNDHELDDLFVSSSAMKRPSSLFSNNMNSPFYEVES